MNMCVTGLFPNGITVKILNIRTKVQKKLNCSVIRVKISIA